MIKHSETRNVNYSSDQMFNLVADIENYPNFIPWCKALKVTSRTEEEDLTCEVLIAEMQISFKVFSETFSSMVTLYPTSKKITVEYINGPFKFLRNTWSFTSYNKGCTINFNVEFEFKSKMMQRLIGVVFQEAMKRIITSFEKRASHLYQ